jgi:hypothetical protein
LKRATRQRKFFAGDVNAVAKKEGSSSRLSDQYCRTLAPDRSRGGNAEVAPEAFNLSKEAHASFREKVFLYREAIILLALLTKVQHEPIFQDVLWEYERILFPETPAGAVRLQAIKTAMSDVRVLIDPDNAMPLSWSVRWFATIDHEEYNPMKHFMLTTFFMSQYIAALVSG